MNLAARLDRAVRAVVPTLVGVSIGDTANKATWKVHPPNLQASAQATIDAFNPTDPAHDAEDLADLGFTTSRQKDILTTCAMLVRARIGIAAWNALSTPNKVTQTLAEADVWNTIRQFIDDKV